jgi:hypothetical protein
MTALTQATCRRLMKVPQIPSVWEVDRRHLGTAAAKFAQDNDADGDCILWVDGSQGMVRAMDVVAAATGHEAVVRTMLRAIEYPHDPGSPARPQKVVVRSKELQFYLRSVLQDLGIGLEYVPELPLIEEIFRSFEQATQQRPPMLPSEFAAVLMQKATDLWQVAPWEVLGDHEILEIEVNQWDLGKIYVSVMGMLGMEFGILLYRSLDSLKQFRERVMADESMEHMEEAFLGQDCLFLTYETNDLPSPPAFLRLIKPEAIPMFGNLHPLEGMRPYLYEEEAQAMIAILEAMCRFIKAHRPKLASDEFPAITSRYKITVPDAAGNKSAMTASIKVTTLPELAESLYRDDDANGESLPSIQDDLVPDNAFISLGMISWETLPIVRSTLKHHQPAQPTQPKAVGDGLPVIVIQTSQPKAKVMMQEIAAMGGLAGIGFNPGTDALLGETYDLGILSMIDETLHLFNEYSGSDPVHLAARKKWDQRCKKTKQICGLLITKGLTGASRGNPKIGDMIALYEVAAIAPDGFGIGIMEKQLRLD